MDGSLCHPAHTFSPYHCSVCVTIPTIALCVLPCVLPLLCVPYHCSVCVTLAGPHSHCSVCVTLAGPHSHCSVCVTLAGLPYHCSVCVTLAGPHSQPAIHTDAVPPTCPCSSIRKCSLLLLTSQKVSYKTYLRALSHTHTHTHIHTHTHTHSHTLTHTHTHTCAHLHLHTHTHAYIYTYTHSHAQKKNLFCSELSYACVGLARTCIYTTYTTVYMMKSLPKISYIHRIYMTLANPTHVPYQ